ncbi:hypothetical protein CHS0354_005761 [Potamilus streckersoni]|uniref:Uncharacterized protein n=1 Tax=Potamilus streckersoni TaxID=2493646 RepID=A0AAE0VTV4_9BIVA|nr:hypothetical protein CHS0354_005761 [Potamilus streckersoni]
MFVRITLPSRNDGFIRPPPAVFAAIHPQRWRRKVIDVDSVIRAQPNRDKFSHLFSTIRYDAIEAIEYIHSTRIVDLIGTDQLYKVLDEISSYAAPEMPYHGHMAIVVGHSSLISRQFQFAVNLPNLHYVLLRSFLAYVDHLGYD